MHHLRSLVLVLATAAAAVAAAQDPVRTVPAEVEVAEIPGRFAFAGPTFEDGLPAYGATFLTQGYVYEPGTLQGRSGVTPDGQPAFPDRLIGVWTCRGWFIADGAHTEAGPAAVTTQLFTFDASFGGATLVTDGVEVMAPGESFERAVVGGTGAFATARGVVTQTLIGMTDDMLVSYAFDLSALAAER